MFSGEKLETKWKRIYEMIDIFAHIDLDGNGRLDEDELATAFKRYGVQMHHMDVDNLITLCDDGGDREVDFYLYQCQMNHCFPSSE